MFYWIQSPNRVFLLSEYWILVPAAVLVDYAIIRKIRLNRRARRKNKELTELRNQLENQLAKEQRLRKILYLSLGLNGYLFFIGRGGSDEIIDTTYILEQCNIAEGTSFLENVRLKKIIYFLYNNKQIKRRIIYITAIALCHIAQQYGQTFLPLPFAIGDFGVTNLLETAQMVSAVALIAAVVPLLEVGTPAAVIIGVVLGTFGMRIGINANKIALSPYILPEVLKYQELVVANNRNQLVMDKFTKKSAECWLPDQTLFNKNCKFKPSANHLALPDYKDVVNMQDVTSLKEKTFSDIYDLGQEQAEPIKSIIENVGKIKRPRFKFPGKTVNFLDKFGDSGPVDSTETWDVIERNITQKESLKTK